LIQVFLAIMKGNSMKRFFSGITLVIVLALFSGCTRIVQMEPTSGPPGTPVYLKCCGMFGDPAAQSLKWDRKTLSCPFPGSFVVPAVNQGGSKGKHTVTLVDNLDANEAFLIFPIFRWRQAYATFTVTPP